LLCVSHLEVVAGAGVSETEGGRERGRETEREGERGSERERGRERGRVMNFSGNVVAIVELQI